MELRFYSTLRFQILTALLSTITIVVADPKPIPVPFDKSKFYGPDGPWQTVQIGLGTGAGATTLNLYPGGSPASTFIGDGYCNSTSDCVAKSAGFYNAPQSPSADYKSIGQPGTLGGWGGETPMNQTGMAFWIKDVMRLGTGSSTSTMQSVAFSTMIWSKYQLPNGSYYNPRVGNLGLGGPSLTESFNGWNGTEVEGNTLTGSLKKSNAIPSSSFGLHIGSVPHNQPGSLILGGYDQSRMLGDVGTFDLGGQSNSQPLVKMVDATIGMEQGASAFSTSSIGSLLRSDVGPAVKMVLNPTVPYMFLPPDMCDAIANWLPLIYQPDLGLYTWNYNDPKTFMIPTSPAFLSFTFQQSSNANFTIKVPFSLLNLTLEQPLSDMPKSYFPCHSAPATDGTYHLGRAFMQAAYLAINWEAKKFFVAQAPGPNSGGSNVVSINPSDTTLKSPTPASSLAATWQGKWGPLPSGFSWTQYEGGPVAASSSTDNGPNEPPAAVKIGVSIGGGIAFVILVALIIYLLIRMRRLQKRTTPMALDLAPPSARKTEKHVPLATAARGFGNMHFSPTLATHTEMAEEHAARDAHGQLAPPNYYGGPPNTPSSPPTVKHLEVGHPAFGDAKFDRSVQRQYRHELFHPPAEMDGSRGEHARDRSHDVHEVAGARGPHDLAHVIDSGEGLGEAARASADARSGSPRTFGGDGQWRDTWPEPHDDRTPSTLGSAVWSASAPHRGRGEPVDRRWSPATSSSPARDRPRDERPLPPVPAAAAMPSRPPTGLGERSLGPAASRPGPFTRHVSHESGDSALGGRESRAGGLRYGASSGPHKAGEGLRDGLREWRREQRQDEQHRDVPRPTAAQSGGVARAAEPLSARSSGGTSGGPPVSRYSGLGAWSSRPGGRSEGRHTGVSEATRYPASPRSPLSPLGNDDWTGDRF